MFNFDFNIILGDRNVGRSQFIFSISQLLKSIGLKIYFLGATHEFRDKRNILEIFDFSDFLSSDDDNNVKIIQKIDEIILTKNIDLLVIDDIDYLSEKLFNMLSKISVRKIATSLQVSSPAYKFYRNVVEYEEYFLSRDRTLTFRGKTVSTEDVLKSIIRDQKINTIIDDKSR